MGARVDLTLLNHELLYLSGSVSAACSSLTGTGVVSAAGAGAGAPHACREHTKGVMQQHAS